MKRLALIGALALALAMVVLAAACGDDDAAPATTGTAAASSAAGEPSRGGAQSSPVSPAASASAGTQAARTPTAIIGSGGTPAASATANPAYASADGASLGPKTAKVTIAVFEDFQCPFCLAYTLQLEPGILTEYVATGKVRYEFHNLPILGVESVAAAVAATCAGQQGKFWPFHDRLFKVQNDAGQARNEQLNVGRFSPDRLRALADEVGLDATTFRDCFDNLKTLPAVQDDARAAQTAGLAGTPGFVINGKALGNAPGTPAAWRTLIDGLLK